MAAYSDVGSGKSYLGRVSVKVSLPDFDFKNREQLREFRRQMRVAHEQGINEGVGILKDVLENKRISDTGALIESVTRKLFVKTTDLFSGTVHFRKPGSEYAYFIEHGRSAGSTPPPLARIADWGRRHGLSFRQSMFVRWKIGEEGISPRPFYDEAADKIHRNYKNLVNNAVERYRRSIK